MSIYKVSSLKAVEDNVFEFPLILQRFCQKMIQNVVIWALRRDKFNSVEEKDISRLLLNVIKDFYVIKS